MKKVSHIGCDERGRSMNENIPAKHFCCSACTKVHDWRVSPARRLAAREKIGCSFACCDVKNEPVVKDCGRQCASAAHLCIHCTQTAFVLCDTCRNDAPLYHDPNHVMVTLFGDGLTSHSIESALEGLHTEPLRWLPMHKLLDDEDCRICETPLEGRRACLSVADDRGVWLQDIDTSKALCELCYLRSIQDGKPLRSFVFVQCQLKFRLQSSSQIHHICCRG